MNIAVCEDKPGDNAVLREYISNYCNTHRYQFEIRAFFDGESLLAEYAPGRFDLVFLDIYLPGISGMDAAKKIRASDRDCLIVFITSSLSHAMEGFMVQATGYVVKPPDREQMNAAMYMCRAAFEKNSRYITAPLYGGEQKIAVAGLRYVEVYNKEAIFHMKAGNLTVRIPLDEIEALLGGEPFLRCHRSYIVNMNHVEDMQPGRFIMHGGDTVPIRKNGAKEVKMAMARFIARSQPGSYATHL